MTQGKFLRHRENILTVFCYVNVIFLCTFGSPGFKRWGFVGDSLSPIAHKMASVWSLEKWCILTKHLES